MKTIILVILGLIQLSAQGSRPIRDDVGFCWRNYEMDSLITWLDKNPIKTLADLSQDTLVAAISPHDDYLYAGKIYSPLFKLIQTKEVVVFGVTHATVRKEINDPSDVIIFDTFKQWKGAYSDVDISPLRERIIKEIPQKYLMINNQAHALEHSIEALIPFLQHYNKDIKITPVMITRMSFDRMDTLSSLLAGVITNYMKEKNLKPGKDVFFLISNDADHYGEDFNNSPYGLNTYAHLTATDNDKRITNTYFNGEMNKEKIFNLTNEIWPDTNSKKITPLWCGRYPIVLGLLTTTKIIKDLTGKSLSGNVLAYTDTWTNGVIPLKRTHMGITAPFSLRHWVGFFSAGFYIK
jgi:AmmeMemoRadiSam system protein B